MNFTVLKAIFKRDLISYFSNPTGYVFICVFVVLSAAAAFWPPEFFSSNLANLDQLTRWMPFILLVFIPAITMSIWAEERRQGTDELLLTIPASDRDVVIGKYLASVAIFTVSLLFSMFAIYLVFSWGLGSPDVGLFIGTYVGYWFVGIAMLAIGMVASFLTSNLTVGFILGMLFNAPLALFGVADLVVKDPAIAQAIKRWSAIEQFRDFEQGVISLAGVTYFVSIAVVMLYLSMILIGRRHWSGSAEGGSRWGHYLVRTLSLLIVAGGINYFLSSHSAVRLDVTSEDLNSLAPQTVRLVKDLADDDDPNRIKVEAFVSPTVPAEYAAQKRNLISTMTELASLSDGKIQAIVNEIENFSEDATRAERQYGIEPQRVTTNSRGTRTPDEIFMGVAISYGLDKVVVPFLDKGIPVEYELIRSIETVSGDKRKRVGVVKTDAPLFGGFSMQGPTQESMLIAELKKQYDVVEVDPTKPITEKFDVLLAVQPSSLAPEAMDNFVSAVKTGQPVAIFEDPFPLPQLWGGELVGTAQEKRPGGGAMGMFGGGGPPQPKGDIQQLWRLLGVEMYGDTIIWQDYNPQKQVGSDIVTPEWIFIDEGLAAQGAIDPFSPESPITSGLSQILYLFSGYLRTADGMKEAPLWLTTTGKETGTVSYQDIEMAAQSQSMQRLRRMPTGERYNIAAKIERTVEDDSTSLLEAAAPKEGAAADAKAAPGKSEVRAVVVADIDCLADPFFQIRSIGADQDALVNWNFQNVTYVLNILDDLAGDDRFIEVRKRTRPHRLLTKIEEATADHRTKSNDRQQKFDSDAQKEIDAARTEFTQKLDEIRNRKDLSRVELEQRLAREQIRLERIRDVKIRQLEAERDRQVRQDERDLTAQIRGVQDRYKFAAVILPPILPILLAAFVYFRRRQAEQEGVSKTRLRYGSAEGAPDEAATAGTPKTPRKKVKV
ncbi:MAG: Gldg family protein [Pirellulales bacterium]